MTCEKKLPLMSGKEMVVLMVDDDSDERELETVQQMKKQSEYQGFTVRTHTGKKTEREIITIKEIRLQGSLQKQDLD